MQQSAVGVGIIAHPAVTLRRKLGDFRLQPTVFVEEFFWPIALHPRFKNADVLWLVHVTHWHLVAAPVAFALFAVDFRRTSPSLRRAEHDHRPGGASDNAFARASAQICLISATIVSSMPANC